MNSKDSSAVGQPVPDAAVQQFMLQQAQAAAIAQSEPRPTRQEALLQETGLITPDISDDDGDLPPPAYGEVYGEIINEKDGLGTSACVTDDGRVNIRINQLNRRLSQIFTPSLRQDTHGVQDGRPPSPPYIPTSLGGEGLRPPPPLNVVIQVVGSRGDVQPFIALGKVLKDTYGHRVRLATHPNFKGFVLENGLEFFSIGGDPSRLMAFMVKNPGLMPGFRTLLSGDVSERRRDVAEYIQGCWRSCYETGDGLSRPDTDDDVLGPGAKPFVADCIIANPPSFAHIHCAEKLGIPLHIMFTMPYSPTQAFPHPLANIQASTADPQFNNYISYAMIELLTWQGLGDIINRFRKKCLGLDPVSLIWAPGMLQRLKVPHTYCWSPALIPKPRDWDSHISISGFYFLNLASAYTPAPALQAFLDAGPPPVYVGFGSIVLDDPTAMTELIFEAARKTGRRVLLSKGWGGMGADELNIPDNVFMLGNVPHDWLFKHVSCVVHHGGAGTTAAGIAAGRPTLIVPFFGDQPFWGAMVAQAGTGPHPIHHKQLTADKLVAAIEFCLKPESLKRAKELAEKIESEKGGDAGAQSFHQHLEVDRLRCTLAPSRPAAWRIKRTKVRLSAFAACTLANENLLDFHDLKLFRPQEYCTDEGPWDPISGGFTAICRAVGNMAMGVADVPSETFKALPIPSASDRQQSQASVQTFTIRSESSHTDARTTSPTLRQHSQASLSVQGSLVSAQESSNLSISSATASGKGYDMLRRKGAHTSKGFGRIVRAAVQSPVDISVGITKGFHNAPKLWGDETVRPQEQVNDMKSGFKAIGKEFGLGFYDGVTGLFTQPWKGAQREGAGGFFKGFGKGLGGFVAKPGAALFSIPAYFMKGVHKEVQKLFGSNVQNYIVASRVAQGYEEWLQSSDEERQDVISRWKLIEKYVKKKTTSDEMVQDVLETQERRDMEGRETLQSHGRAPISTPPLDRMETPAFKNLGESMPVVGGSQSRSHLSGPVTDATSRTAENSDASSLPPSHTFCNDVAKESGLKALAQEPLSPLQLQRQDAAEHRLYEENLRQAMVSSEAEAQQNDSEALNYERQLKQTLEQSLREHIRRISDDEWESYPGTGNGEDAEFDRTSGAFGQTMRSARPLRSMASESSNGRCTKMYDQEHLAGSTRSEFETQGRGEKTSQEKTEEEIVLEYVRKQSLLEVHHSNKGKGRATAAEDEEDEDLQKALKWSMQGREHNLGYQHGNGSEA
ncbi:Sterol 3-beta-glucosyltransferase UGT80B1 [Paramyrothecium foliicola]|nr:Sterol 3-beta-glucosyltransferase UGT80B1 [Paramyrothecium foliicola]